GPFGSGVTWANSGAANGTNLFNQAAQPIDTGWCGSGNAGFTLNDTAQLRNLYNTSISDQSGPSWSTIHAPTVTIALEPYYQGSQPQEGWQTFCVSHLYYNPSN